MNSNIASKLEELSHQGVYFELKNEAELQTALTTQSAKVLQFLAESDDWGVQAAVTKNPFCTSMILRKLAEKNSWTKRIVCLSSRCPGDIIDDYVRNQDIRNLCWDDVLEFPNIEYDTLFYLMNRSDEFTKYVAKHSAKQELLAYIEMAGKCYDELLENPNTSPELLTDIYEKMYDSIYTGSIKLAAHPNAGKETLKMLTKTGVWFFRNDRSRHYVNYIKNVRQMLNNVASNPNTTMETLEYLWTANPLPDDSELRNAIKKHKNAPSCSKDISDESDD